MNNQKHTMIYFINITSDQFISIITLTRRFIHHTATIIDNSYFCKLTKMYLGDKIIQVFSVFSFLEKWHNRRIIPTWTHWNKNDQHFITR